MLDFSGKSCELNLIYWCDMFKLQLEEMVSQIHSLIQETKKKKSRPFTVLETRKMYHVNIVRHENVGILHFSKQLCVQ